MKEQQLISWLQGLCESESQGPTAQEALELVKAMMHEIRQLRKNLRQERERSARLGAMVTSIEDGVAYLRSVFLPDYAKAQGIVSTLEEDK